MMMKVSLNCCKLIPLINETSPFSTPIDKLFSRAGGFGLDQSSRDNFFASLLDANGL